MSNPPLKRHPVLQPLSREHMSGLVHARNLSTAAAESPAHRSKAIAAFRHAWESELLPHFKDEEELLSRLLSEADRDRLEAEHSQLTEIATRFFDSTASPDPALFTLLGTLLHDHIRWEERELFPAAEAAASPADLESLSRAAARIEHDRPGSRPRLRL